MKETTAIKRLLKLKKKIRDVRGGTGAGKTIGILTWDIDFAQSNKKVVIDVVSESYPHLEQGAIRDFKNIMTSRNYWKDNRWNDSKHLYKFETGSTIQFQSYDKLGKAHGPRRDVLHLNEANWLPWEVVNQLVVRTRKVVWCEYNPLQEFWMHTEVLGRRDDVESLKLTYKDNEGLTDAEVHEIEARKNNARWWRVYGEGELGEAEGRVYTGWRIIDDIPHEARYEGAGIDFGYSTDPAAIIDVYYMDGGYIFDEILYATQLENRQLATVLKNRSPAIHVADSAEPKSIKEISNFGINIIGAEKGKDSVRYGVKTLQGLRISVTSRSLNLIREYRNYFQAVDRKTNNNIIGQYDGECHALDAARYKLCSLIPIKQKQELRKIVGEMYRNQTISPQINPV